MRRWLVVGLLVTCVGVVTPAHAFRVAYRGAIVVAGEFRARTRLRGEAAVSLLGARVDSSFRCAGRGCLFRRGFFEWFCTASDRAFGTISDRRTGADCAFDGLCAGSQIVGTFTCPTGQRGRVSLLFKRR